jgi:hypothetical protein
MVVRNEDDERRKEVICGLCGGSGILTGFPEEILNLGQPPEIDCPRCDGSGKEDESEEAGD